MRTNAERIFTAEIRRSLYFCRFFRMTFIEKDYKFEELEPWVADILSIKLVSKEELIKTLAPYNKQTEHKADYYYLVKAKISSQSPEGIVAISTEENAIISPYSPKIVKLYDGKDTDSENVI